MKIVSLVPSYTEILFSLGLDRELIGVTEHCDFPLEAKNIEKIGTFANPDPDKIIDMTPELVCADPALHKKAIKQLRDKNVEVFSPWLHSVNDVLQSMEDLATLSCQQQAVLDVVKPLRERVGRVIEGASGKYRPRVFRVMNDVPTITPGPYAVQYDAIKLAGGTLMPMEDTAYVQVTREELIRFNPEILLFCGRRKSDPKRPRCKGCLSKNPMCQREVDEIITNQWSGVNAVRDDKVYPLSCDVLCRPGVRLIAGIEKLNKYFQGV